jgi:hypothetical protein
MDFTRNAMGRDFARFLVYSKPYTTPTLHNKEDGWP